MGRESGCRARYEGRTVDGRALLETDVVLFRAPGLRVQVPISAVSTAESHDGWLRLVWGDESIELDLGPQAETWAERVRNPRSLMDKLGVKAGMRVSVVRLPDEWLREELEARGAEVSAGRTVRGSDLILYRADSIADLRRLERLKASLVPDGGIWVVFPKGDRSMRDVDVMAAAKEAGLVDVKVSRWSETYTAQKLVIPRALR